jgi:putative membrane protein
VHLANFWPVALQVSLVIGLANALVRPLVVLLTLPVTVLTLGLFLLVINGAMLLLADWALLGFAVDGWLWAIIGAVVLSVVSSILDGLLLES